MDHKKRTAVQKIAIGGLMLEAAGWAGLALAYLIRMSEGTMTDIMLMALMAGNGIAFGLLAWGMIRGKKPWLFLSILWVGLNLTLTFTDQFGAADWAALTVNGGLLILLIAGRYKRRSKKTLCDRI